MRGLFMLCAGALFACSANAQLYGVDFDTGRLFRVNPANAALTLIGNTNQTGLGDLQRAPNGNYYTFTTGASAALYTVNVANANVTAVGGGFGLSFVFEGALAFGPTGTAYATNAGEAANPNLFTINLTSGAATAGPVIGAFAHDINGMVWFNNKLYGIDREINGILSFDPATGNATQERIYNAAGGEPLLGEVGGMTMDQSGTVYFCTAGTNAVLSGDNALYTLNMTTFAATKIGNFDAATINGTGISGLATATPAPEPATIAVLLIGAGAISGRRLARRFGKGAAS
ncbi:MAG: PEP-CTERM sorting domain-containing protein [Fimbriimonadales bacterium]